MMLERIRTDLTTAIKENDQTALSALRMLLAEIHNREIEKKAALTDEEVFSLVQKEVKKREEAIGFYQKGKREDLVENEKKELAVLNKYLPRQLTPQDLEAVIEQVIKETGAKGGEDFGKVMGMVMARVKGRAAGTKVAELVKKLLNSRQ